MALTEDNLNNQVYYGPVMFTYEEKEDTPLRVKEFRTESVSFVERVVRLTLNCLLLPLLALAVLSFFFDYGLGLRYGFLSYSILIIAYDFFLFIRGIRKGREYKKEKEKYDDIKFLFHPDVIEGIFKEGKNTRNIAYKYTDIQRMAETENFLNIDFGEGKHFYFDKSCFNTRKVEFDGMRLKLVKTSDKLIEVQKNLKGPRYEFTLDQSQKNFFPHYWEKILFYWSFIFLPVVIIANLRSYPFPLDLPYLYFILAFFDFVIFIVSLVLKANQETIRKKEVLLTALTSFLVMVGELIGGSFTYIFHDRNNYSTFAKTFTEKTSITLPSKVISEDYYERAVDTSLDLEGKNTFIFYDTYAKGQIGNNKDKELVDSFVQDTEHWRQMTEIKNYGDIIISYGYNISADYFLLYSEERNEFFPNEGQVLDASDNNNGESQWLDFATVQIDDENGAELNKYIIEIRRYNIYQDKYIQARSRQ